MIKKPLSPTLVVDADLSKAVTKTPRKTLSAEDVAKKGAALKPVKTFQA